MCTFAVVPEEEGEERGSEEPGGRRGGTTTTFEGGINTPPPFEATLPLRAAEDLLPPEKKGVYASLAREKDRLEAARGETLPEEAALGGEVKRSRRLAFVKGSLEDVLPRCVSRVGADGATLEPLGRRRGSSLRRRRSREGSRVLLVARGEYRRDAVLIDEYTSPSPSPSPSPSLGGPLLILRPMRATPLALGPAL